MRKSREERLSASLLARFVMEWQEVDFPDALIAAVGQHRAHNGASLPAGAAQTFARAIALLRSGRLGPRLAALRNDLPMIVCAIRIRRAFRDRKA